MSTQRCILYTPFFRVTGSENADSHKNTYCIDIAGSANESSYGTLNFLLAPFDCEVKYIHRDSNSVFFESLDGNQIQTPSGTYPKICFRCAHMNDTEWDLLNMAVGRTFLQGEPCYFEGTKMNGNSNGCGKHMHVEFGNGSLTLPTGKTIPLLSVSAVSSSGATITNHTISCTGGKMHIYNSCYLHNNSIMETEGNPADNYVYTSTNFTSVSASTYVLSVPTSTCKMNLTVGPYTLRKYPGGANLCGSYTFPAGSQINVLGFQPIKHTDNKYYYRASANYGGSVKVGYMQYDPEEVYPTGSVKKVCVKLTARTRIRTSMNTSLTTNIVRVADVGELFRVKQFYNCAAGDHNNGWIKLSDNNYMQYDTDCMYLFGLVNY